MILLGHIVYSGNYGENKLYADIEEHFLSIDDYLDTIIVKKLKESGHDIKDFYGLLMLILSNFNELVLDSSNTVNNMFVKSLEVLYYMLEDITHSIFKVNFRLSKLSNKRMLTISDVTETFNRFMKQGSVFKLTSGKIILESVSYSGDNKYPKITSKITEQESLSGKGGTRTAIGLDKHLDISMIEAGSVLFISKANPSPTGRINPFVRLDLATGTILSNPKLAAIRDKTANNLRGITTSDISLLEDDNDDISDD
jgi:DNA-binding MarR family transcriptional regulator